MSKSMSVIDRTYTLHVCTKMCKQNRMLPKLFFVAGRRAYVTRPNRVRSHRTRHTQAEIAQPERAQPKRASLAIHLIFDFWAQIIKHIGSVANFVRISNSMDVELKPDCLRWSIASTCEMCHNDDAHKCVRKPWSMTLIKLIAVSFSLATLAICAVVANAGPNDLPPYNPATGPSTGEFVWVCDIPVFACGRYSGGQ